jgi:mycofactocin biosynthesis protein MftB
MACAASTEPVTPFDLDAPWRLDAQVRVRPEAFGALLYHFGTRQLSFLKSPMLAEVVRTLSAQPSARAACAAAGVPARDLLSYERALATLAASEMIREREAA